MRKWSSTVVCFDVQNGENQYIKQATLQSPPLNSLLKYLLPHLLCNSLPPIKMTDKSTASSFSTKERLEELQLRMHRILTYVQNTSTRNESVHIFFYLLSIPLFWLNSALNGSSFTFCFSTLWRTIRFTLFSLTLFLWRIIEIQFVLLLWQFWL